MRRKGNPTALIVLAIILLLAAISAAVVGFTGPAELKNVKDITAADMSVDYSYEIEELFIVDQYMVIYGDKKDNTNGNYYLAGFYGEDGKFYFVSLYADGDKELKSKLSDYANDYEAQIGELIISGCFTTSKVSSVDSDDNFYNKVTSKYKNTLLAEGITCADTELHLKFVCEDAEDYASEASTTPLIIVAFVLAGLGVALLFFAINLKKKIKAEEEARAHFNYNQPTDFYPPYQGQ